MNITIEQLNAFLAVAETLSFSRAAELIFRTQSAVSIQIAKLEESVGYSLFHRTTKRIELTEAGIVFLRLASRIRSLMEQTEQQLLDLKKMEQGRLSICTSDTTACYRLPKIIQAYQTKYPGIDIIVRNATSIKTISMVEEGQVDLGIATLKYLKPNLISIPLFYRSDVVICHPDHYLTDRTGVYLKDLEKYPCILLDQKCSSRRILDEACRKAGAKLNISMELSSIEVVKHFVLINSGISVVPEIAVEKEVSEKRLVVLKVHDFSKMPQVQMGLIYRKDHYLSLAAHSFLKLIKQILG